MYMYCTSTCTSTWTVHVHVLYIYIYMYSTYTCTYCRCTVHVYACSTMHCAVCGIKRGQSLGSFHWNSNGKIKKHISYRLQKGQGCWFSSNVRGRNAQPYTRLSYWSRCTVYSVRDRGRRTVCAEFIRPEISTGGSTVVSAHYDNNIGQVYCTKRSSLCAYA